MPESEEHKRVYEAIGYRPNAETVAELRSIFAPEPPPAVEEQGDEREWTVRVREHPFVPMVSGPPTDYIPVVPKSRLTTERHRRESAEQERDEQIEVVNGLGEKLDAERHRREELELREATGHQMADELGAPERDEAGRKLNVNGRFWDLAHDLKAQVDGEHHATQPRGEDWRQAAIAAALAFYADPASYHSKRAQNADPITVDSGQRARAALALALAEQPRQAQLIAECERLRAILDHPDPHDFIKASTVEAKFQMDLWGTAEGFPTAFDGQEDHHFVYLIAYLVGKVAATPDEDREKKLHRITTVAAAAANWHIVTTGRKPNEATHALGDHA